jgi:uncharacterized protein YbjT (DUF2867 family)
MTRILITGGTGFLGTELTPRLVNAGYTVRVMSRSARTPDHFPDVEWAQADLETHSGLAEAVKDVDIIVNAATGAVKNPHQVDVIGARKLLELARAAAVQHVVHISIIGIERIPFSYYKHKVAAEQVIRESNVPWSILRAAQFHPFIDLILSALNRFPLVLPAPTDFQTQPIDVGEVAERLVEIVAAPPAGMLPDIAGPETLRLGDMAKVWLKAQGLRRPIVHLPIPAAWAAGFRKGYNTDPRARYGKITWADWVQQKYDIQAENRSSLHQAAGG